MTEWNIGVLEEWNVGKMEHWNIIPKESFWENIVVEERKWFDICKSTKLCRSNYPGGVKQQ